MSPSPPVLHDYQQVAQQFLMTRPKAAAFLDMGFGKTLTSLHTLNRLMPSGHILVIAPLNIIRSTWIDEIEKWGFAVRVRSLALNDKGKSLPRKKRLERYEEVFTSSPTMFFINQELIHDLVENMPMKTINGKKTKLWPFETIIIDESQGFKNPSSKRFKALKKVSPHTKRIIELTGTPSPNGPLDLWSQMYLLDEGEALGKTFSEYRAKYFYESKYVDGRPVAWTPLPGATDEIYRRIKHLAISVENTSIKMPPRLPVNDILIHLSESEMDLYQEMKKEAVLSLIDQAGDEVTITSENAGALMARLIQMSSGTLYTDEKHNYKVLHQRKIEYLDYMLNNISTPVIVPHRFNADKIELMRELKKRGHDAHLFDGSREMVKAWNEGKLPVMLLQPASAGHGLNLQDGGHTLIWYSLPHSLEHYAQTNARLDRQGQKNPVAIHRLITAGTRDTLLPLLLEGKHMTQAALLDAVKLEISDVIIGATVYVEGQMPLPSIDIGDHEDGVDDDFDISQLL